MGRTLSSVVLVLIATASGPSHRLVIRAPLPELRAVASAASECLTRILVIPNCDTEQLSSEAVQTDSDAPRPESKGWLSREMWKIVLTVFICSIFIGYMLGRARSPDFEDPTRSPIQIRSFVAKCAAAERAAEYRRAFNLDGSLKSISPMLRNFSFTCGVTTFVYNCDAKSLAKEPFRPKSYREQGRPPRNNLKFSQTLALIVGGGAEAYSVKSVVPEITEYVIHKATGEDRIRAVILSLLALASGFVVGFKLGYVNRPKCGEKLFQELLHDVVFWQGVAEEYEELHKWSFSYRGGAILVHRVNISSPPLNLKQWNTVGPPPVEVVEDLIKSRLEGMGKRLVLAV